LTALLSKFFRKLHEYYSIGKMYNFRVPEGLEDVSKYPMLLAELARDRRWSAEDIKKLAGGNLIRVMRETERVRP
jgi:microsomal dipeptidase-like Zn-dependent dipeptidase